MYDSPHQFEPLIPLEIPVALRERAASVARLSLELSGSASPAARTTMMDSVRAVNAFYSNWIEGESAHPCDVEKALRGEFSDEPDIARRQRIAVAHIEAERALADRVEQGELPMSSRFLLEAHKSLYSRLGEVDRVTSGGRVIVPGRIREVDVEVGQHVAPSKDSIWRFLERMDEVYLRKMDRDMQLIAIACAHHRAMWVHPFLDGNGRSIRLQTHCALWPLAGGLWSISRGLAGAQEEYYVRLSNADHPRRGNYDGRGNLTTKGLIQWVEFFLEVCEEEVRFMVDMLDSANFLVDQRFYQLSEVAPTSRVPAEWAP